MPTRAVIFSFDGVLADTANVHVAAWQRTFRVMAWNESDESCARAAGSDDQSFAAEVFARRKIDGGDAAGWAERKQALTLQLLRDRPLLMPGAAALVHSLRTEGVRLGIVTSTRRANVETVLAASGLLDAFEVIEAGDAPSSRPDAAAYQRAIARLGLDPSEAVALVGHDAERQAVAGAMLRAVVVRPSSIDRSLADLADLTDLASVRELLGFFLDKDHLAPGPG